MAFSFFARDNGFIHICGHRGHCIGAPENTIAAFRMAHELGATTCEIDTVLTRDKQIVVLHDLSVDRTTNGSGAAKDLTAAEIAALDAGSGFGAQFAGEPVPTLRQALAAAAALELGYEVEVKEKLDLPGFAAALRQDLADPADFERVLMISFDHASLKALKQAIPGIRTGGIVHERFSDPVAVAQSSDLDELCIDLSVFDPRDAEKLHAAGIAIRCHAYNPAAMARAKSNGLDWQPVLASALRAGLIDTLSSDDVDWARRFRDAALA